MVLAHATRFKGLLPALDRRQIPEPFCMDGQNFILDAEGPYSGFGNQIASNDRISDAKIAKAYRTDDKDVFPNKLAIYGYQEVPDIFEPLFTFSDTLENFPWSCAFVGAKFYFARHGVTGIIEYNPTTNAWQQKTTDVPADIYAVARSNGRLIVLSVSAVTWSEIGNGLNLITDLELGIGSQVLAEHTGGGTPLGIVEVADGFITFTTEGLMKSEYTAAQNPFRHFQLSGKKHVPLSPFCIVTIADSDRDAEHIILTKTGLYKIQSGNVPVEWQPIMGQYLIRKVFPRLNVETSGIIRLSYSEDRQWFFISIADTEQPFQFTRAYCMYLPINEFGIFNRAHVNFGNLTLNTNILRTFNFGYVDELGALRQFTDLNVHETTIDRIRYEIYHTPYEFEMERNPSNSYIAKTVIRARTHDQSGFNTETGVYDLDTDESIPEIYETLDAFLDIGLYRVTDEDHPSKFTNAWVVSIGMEEEIQGQIFEDWNNEVVDIFEDWGNEAATTYEDWGFLVNPRVDYDAQIFGTLDGYNTHANQVYDLQEMEQDPDELDAASRVKIFDACGCTGIYIYVRVKAQEENQSFHLKLQELKLTLGGVM